MHSKLHSFYEVSYLTHEGPKVRNTFYVRALNIDTAFKEALRVVGKGRRIRVSRHEP